MGDIPAVVPPTPRGPHPWLAPILSVIAIGVTVLWAYLQMRHWKEPDADYVAMATNIVVTLVLWIILIVAIFTAYRFKKASALQARPVVNKNIVAGFVLFAALGLGGAWYLARGYKPTQSAAKQEPPQVDQPQLVVFPESVKRPINTAKKSPPETVVKAKGDGRSSEASTLSTGSITQGNCGVVQVGGTQNQAAGGSCSAVPFRTLSDPQKAAIKQLVDSMPASVHVTVGSVIGSGDGDNYALLFFPLFDGRHLDNETTPRIRTGFPAAFTGVFVATVSEDDSASQYRNALVDRLISLGILAHRANGSKIAPGNLEFVIGYRPEEVKPQ